MAPPRKPAAEPEPEAVEASEPASDDVEEQEDLASRLARAQEDVAAGRVTVYGNDEEFLASLKALEEGTPSVTQALSRVMGDVQSVSKDSRNTSQNFNFRGIDAVMNAVGPALREHGVVVVPIKTKYDAEHYQTKQGTNMKNVTLTVTFRFYGPKGDYIDTTATGEAADSGDKAMPKAHSVAFRTMLLQALCIPTDEPDPDLEAHDRAAQPFQEGATAQDPRPVERRVEKPEYNFPKDWKELAGRMATLFGLEEAVVWMSQAKALVAGCPPDQSVTELPEEQQRAVWHTLTEVLRSLDEELKVDPNAFPPPTRAEIQGEFAKHLDGEIIAGPKWALSGEEAESGYPTKEFVLTEQSAEPPEDPDPEPSDQEAMTLAEEIAAEEAAAAAERDRDQARDASGK